MTVHISAVVRPRRTLMKTYCPKFESVKLFNHLQLMAVFYYFDK